VKFNATFLDLEVSYTVSFGTLNLALRAWSMRKNFEQIGNATDRLSFVGSPVRTNAWYQQGKNSIVIPMGELHSPAFGEGTFNFSINNWLILRLPKQYRLWSSWRFDWA
jgi:hypothetical protein